MRKSLILAAALFATPALAQPAPNTQQTIDGAAVTACDAVMSLRSRVLADQTDTATMRQQIAVLQQRLAELSKPPPSSPEPMAEPRGTPANR